MSKQNASLEKAINDYSQQHKYEINDEAKKINRDLQEIESELHLIASKLGIITFALCGCFLFLTLGIILLTAILKKIGG